MDKIAWHEYCVLRDDVRQGTLTLAEFAADLYAVRTGDARNVYQLPNLFFDSHLPNLQSQNVGARCTSSVIRTGWEARDPMYKSTYGGGKTHALIALLHLAERGDELKTHPTVREFMGFSGVDRVATGESCSAAVRQIRRESGAFGGQVLMVRQRQVKTPWGALAYQLAGDEGLAKVAEHETNYIAPAEPILVELLKAPQAAGLSTLILIDEALIYMCATLLMMSRSDWGFFRNFFQMLTQAVGKVERVAMVASLISADILSNDPTGVQVLDAIGRCLPSYRKKRLNRWSREDVSELLQAAVV